MLKRCSKCLADKDIGDFYQVSQRNGTKAPYSYCKVCSSAAVSHRYLKHKRPVEVIPDLDGEICVFVGGYEGLYSVSNMGRIKSLRRLVKYIHGKNRVVREKLLKPTPNADDYLKVGLCRNGQKESFTVHCLVSDAFLPIDEEKPEINHKNGIKSDNRAINLERCTRQENVDHKYDVLGYGHPFSGVKLSREFYLIDFLGNKTKRKGIAKLAREIGGNPAGVYDALNGKRKTYKGYKFEYV